MLTIILGHLVRLQDLNEPNKQYILSDYLNKLHTSKLDLNPLNYPNKLYISKLDLNLPNYPSKWLIFKLDSNLLKNLSNMVQSQRLDLDFLKCLNNIMQLLRFNSKKITTIFQSMLLYYSTINPLNIFLTNQASTKVMIVDYF